METITSVILPSALITVRIEVFPERDGNPHDGVRFAVGVGDKSE